MSSDFNYLNFTADIKWSLNGQDIFYYNKQRAKGGNLHNKNYNEQGFHKNLLPYLTQEVMDYTLANAASQISGVMVDRSSGEVLSVQNLVGIHAEVNKQANAYGREVAEEILALAKMYCPISDNEDPGHVHLVDTGVIDETPDGGWRVSFLAPYAWFVHEFIWNNIVSARNTLGRHKFLSLAVYEVEKKYGWWA